MTDVVIARIGHTEVSKHWILGLGHLVPATAIFLLSVLAGCASKPTEPVIRTPTIHVITDSFFSAQAFLDTNGNGQIDTEDKPLANAAFIVTLQGGGEFGDKTDESGYAFIIIPGGVEYPVTLRMEAPKNSTLKLVGPSEITYSPDTSESKKFLFSVK